MGLIIFRGLKIFVKSCSVLCLVVGKFFVCLVIMVSLRVIVFFLKFYDRFSIFWLLFFIFRFRDDFVYVVFFVDIGLCFILLIRFFLIFFLIFVLLVSYFLSLNFFFVMWLIVLLYKLVILFDEVLFFMKLFM